MTDPTSTPLHDQLDDDLRGELRDELRDLLSALVGVASENPTLAAGGAGEAAIADYITVWATGAGLEVERVEPTPGRPSLLVTARATTRPADPTAASTSLESASAGSAPAESAPPQGRRPALLLCGHLDTVGIGAAGVEPRVEGDRLYGRGAYDMKAGLAAALIALRESARLGLERDVVLAAVADEEDASLGVQQVLDVYATRSGGEPPADAAIVLEPTELAVVTAHRGFAWVQIEVRGVAAHGSRPHLGVDAITRMAPVVTALDGFNAELASIQHPLLGAGFLHASTITGGAEASTIPDRCTLVVERRTLPSETQSDVEDQIEQVLDACRRADPLLDVSVRTRLYRPALETDPTHPHVRALQAAATRVLGRSAALEGASYWADSALIAAAGVPTVLFGPAGEGAHASEEWVSLSSTEDCTRTLLDVIRSSSAPLEASSSADSVPA